MPRGSSKWTGNSLRLDSDVREFGYAGYHRQLEFELLSDLQPVDAVDATALRPGVHDVEVVRVHYVGAGVRVTYRGTGGRIHTHEYTRRDDYPGHPLRARCTVELRRAPGADLYRTAAGGVVAILEHKLVGGPYPSVSEARLHLGDKLARTMLVGVT